jgi:hypothetical protein
MHVAEEKIPLGLVQEEVHPEGVGVGEGQEDDG